MCGGVEGRSRVEFCNSPVCKICRIRLIFSASVGHPKAKTVSASGDPCSGAVPLVPAVGSAPDPSYRLATDNRSVFPPHIFDITTPRMQA